MKGLFDHFATSFIGKISDNQTFWGFTKWFEGCALVSDEEFLDYLDAFDDDKKKSLITAGEFLKQLDDAPHKNTIRNAVSNYIVDEIIIDYAYKNFNTSAARRLYEYYNKVYQRQCELLK